MPWAPNSPLTAGAATLVLHPHPSPSLSPLPLTLRQAHYLRQNPFRARRHAFLNCHHQTRSFGIRSIDPPRITRYNSGPESPTLLSSPKAALQRRLEADTLPLRTGALAIKKGMTSMFDLDSGARIPCTVLQMDRVQVVAHKTRRRHGYHAVCVGHGWRRAKNISKPMLGHYSSQGVPPKAELREFRVRDHRGLLAVGTEINADWFITGQFVDTRSHCKGKGFQGVMKRWGMHGQDRSHGASLSHRSLGSAGQGQGGGSRVYPGKKMAGNMGGQRNTVQSLKVMQVDANSGVVVVHGAVSGPKGCTVMIQDALKKPWPDVPFAPPPPPPPPKVEFAQSSSSPSAAASSPPASSSSNQQPPQAESSTSTSEAPPPPSPPAEAAAAAAAEEDTGTGAHTGENENEEEKSASKAEAKEVAEAERKTQAQLETGGTR